MKNSAKLFQTHVGTRMHKDRSGRYFQSVLYISGYIDWILLSRLDSTLWNRTESTYSFLIDFVLLVIPYAVEL